MEQRKQGTKRKVSLQTRKLKLQAVFLRRVEDLRHWTVPTAQQQRDSV